MPYLDDATRAQPDIYKKVAETLNAAGAEAKKAGVQIAYHNHNFEFYPVNGQLPFDFLLATCDANLVKFEMDLCWIVAGGQDPLTYFAKYPGRFPLVHVKDLKKMPVREAADTGAIPTSRVIPDIADVGDGMIDWKRIFAKSAQAGIQHYIVEHDQPPSPFADIQRSYDYLSKLTF
jgi:sugar phosphate isomerase/epimerase